jgi:hypothetical protein
MPARQDAIDNQFSYLNLHSTAPSVRAYHITSHHIRVLQWPCSILSLRPLRFRSTISTLPRLGVLNRSPSLRLLSTMFERIVQKERLTLLDYWIKVLFVHQLCKQITPD